MSDDEERAARRKAVFEQLNDNSEAISKQSRNILIGVGSVAWTALISGKLGGRDIEAEHFLIVILTTAIGLCFDFFQYFCAYFSSYRAWRRFDYRFPKYEAFRILRFWLFYSKIGAAILSYALLMFALIWALMT